jgi:methionine sulfoxide reductase heme-binding subunit
MDITLLDLCAYLGQIAVGAVTLNMLLGTLMIFRYSPVRSWPHRRFNYFRLHNWTGYIALSFALAHPIILLFNKSPRFRIVDLFYPIHSPQQPFENTLGAIALYTLLVIVATSYARIQLGRRLWKAFHFSIYLGAIALFWHALFTDPDLKGAPIEWLDAGKMFVETCTAIIIVAALVRWRHSRNKAIHRKERSRQTAASS